MILLYLGRPAEKPTPPVPQGISIPVAPLEMKAVAVIIDDFGHSRPAARPFLEMEYPVAMSFLPGRPFTRELAAEARAMGKTLLLHLPMEPEGYPAKDPGPGAILLSHGRREIHRILEEDLSTVPGVVGVNNHMGSRATADERVMEAVLDEIRNRGFFFIDSRTSPQTLGFVIATRMGIRTAERDVFLDNDPDPAAIDARVDELLDLAEKRGWAIGIGHAHPLTAEALEKMAVKARQRGIQWISLESLIAYVDPGNRNIVR